MVKFAVVLKTGGDYDSSYVERVERMAKKNLSVAHEFVCLSDVPGVPGYQPLYNCWPGWWSVIELFRLTGPVIVTGLDTLIVKNIDRLGELALTCPEDVFYMSRPQPKAARRGEKWCSGIMIWNGDWSWLYHKFDYETHSKKYKLEQRYTAHMLSLKRRVKIRAVQDYFDGYTSYKNDCKRGLPAGAKVVLFHGKPRPHECKAKWVKKIWDDSWRFEHPFESLCTVGEDEIEEE